jgi:hypothetical protein
MMTACEIEQGGQAARRAVQSEEEWRQAGFGSRLLDAPPRLMQAARIARSVTEWHGLEARSAQRRLGLHARAMG